MNCLETVLQGKDLKNDNTLCLGLHREIDATSFANSPPNEMSHCLQWGLDWKVREGSATSLMKCTFFLDRRLCKLSIDTLFTPFGLQINKLGEEKRGKK